MHVCVGVCAVTRRSSANSRYQSTRGLNKPSSEASECGLGSRNSVLTLPLLPDKQNFPTVADAVLATFAAD